MQRKKADVDVILDVLKETLLYNPTSTFVSSLLFQYQERGGLSKKQLEGLHHKASKVATIAPGKLATLEAIILKKPMKHKSPLPVPTPLYVKDEMQGKLITEILNQYPQHKRVLFLKSRYDNNQPLAVAEMEELKRFHKILLK
ncbi:MAG: hypothetical protein WCG67_00385 [Ferruginibacter sp.]